MSPRTIASALAILSLAACSIGYTDAPRTDLVDPGGLISVRADEIALANAHPTGVARPIPMLCLSSCTMYLALDAACLRPGTRLGFHGPAWDGVGLMNQEDADKWAGVMADHYPASIRALYWETMRHSQEITIVQGDDLVRDGIIPACKG